jgi:hypothetical protein
VLVLGAGAAKAEAKARARILTLGQPGFKRTPVRTAGNHVSQLSHCCCALSMALQVTVIDTVSALSAAFLLELQNTLQLPSLQGWSLLQTTPFPVWLCPYLAGFSCSVAACATRVTPFFFFYTSAAQTFVPNCR